MRMSLEPLWKAGVVIEENRPFLIILQSENDQATGHSSHWDGVYNTINLRYHWDKVSVPGRHGSKVSERILHSTPGNNPYLVNYHVVPLGEATAPPDLRRRRTGHSKPISGKTCKTRSFTPVNVTMARKPFLPQ